MQAQPPRQKGFVLSKLNTKMKNKEIQISRWDLYSLITIGFFLIFQLLRWRILPQFMDMYYHLQTAWGFLQAGGYSGWDFWQYAPAGRTHIYPPLFHIILAILLKLGINKIILAKLVEIAAPTAFLFTIWYFIKHNFGRRLAFFVLITLSASTSFYLSLFNNIPATLGIIFGITAINAFLHNKPIRSVLLLAACFYSHIGISYMFLCTILLLGLMNKRYFKLTALICLSALIMSCPIILKQIQTAATVSLSGIAERYFCEFKTLEYLFAIIGIWVILRGKRQYLIFICFFLASFVLIMYPYRFFSAQGYLSIGLLAAVAIDFIYEKLNPGSIFTHLVPIILVIYFLVFSPTIIMHKDNLNDKTSLRFFIFDTAAVNVVLPNLDRRIASQSLWFPADYLHISEIIQDNSNQQDIIYSDNQIAGLALASVSGRPTANALLPEIKPSRDFNPLLSSKIIVLTKNEDMNEQNTIAASLNLKKLGESGMFVAYNNPSCITRNDFKPSRLKFWLIYLIIAVIAIIALFGDRITQKILVKRAKK